MGQGCAWADFYESQPQRTRTLCDSPLLRLRLGSSAVRRASQKGGAVEGLKGVETGHSRCTGVEERMGSALPRDNAAGLAHLSRVDWPAGAWALGPPQAWHQWAPRCVTVPGTAPWSLFTDKSGSCSPSLLDQQGGTASRRKTKAILMKGK